MPQVRRRGRMLLAPMVGAILFAALALAAGLVSTAGTQAAFPPTSGVPIAPQATATSCTSGAWTAQAVYPTPIADNTAASRGGSVYSSGGPIKNASTPPAYKYAPAINAWTSIAPLPSARSQASAVSDGTYVYILGGSDQTSSPTATIWRYDPS